MAINIKGMNTGVIRQGDTFVALAFKIKQPRNKETTLFLPALVLRDLLIALEHRLWQHSQMPEEQRLAMAKARDAVIKKMHASIPTLTVEELRDADVSQRVDNLELCDNKGENLLFKLSLHGGDILDVEINELQIALIVQAIIHAINNAKMRELSLRLSSLLDFLPLYDVDCLENGSLEYDTYQQPEWKLQLFNHYLAMIYQYTDEQGKQQQCGTVVKTRSKSETKQAEAISRRLLAYSRRLSKLKDKPCQVFVKTITTDNAHPLSQEQCMRALYQLRMSVKQKASA